MLVHKPFAFMRLLPLLLFPISCNSAPTAVDSQFIVIQGSTVDHQGVELTFLKYNESWFPRDDSETPAEDRVFMTFLVRIENQQESTTFVDINSLRLRTLKFSHPHEGPTWEPFAGGRIPTIATAGSLAPGEFIEGWLTFRLPKGSIPEELLWAPDPHTTYAIEIPVIVMRSVEAFVFGQVTGPDGTGLSSIPITITPVRVPALPGFETTVGDCTGTPLPSIETQTDDTGSYQHLFSVVNVELLCIDVQALPPPGSLFFSMRGAGTVYASKVPPLAEPPEIRIDLMLPSSP